MNTKPRIFRLIETDELLAQIPNGYYMMVEDYFNDGGQADRYDGTELEYLGHASSVESAYALMEG